MAVIIASYALLWLPLLFLPTYLNTTIGFIAVIPLLFVYLFHRVGVPGLLEYSGSCGWGWCSPTPFGWLLLLVFWFLVVWLLARFIVRRTRR